MASRILQSQVFQLRLLDLDFPAAVQVSESFSLTKISQSNSKPHTQGIGFCQQRSFNTYYQVDRFTEQLLVTSDTGKDFSFPSL